MCVGYITNKKFKFSFWKKSHRLTKAAFIWLKTDKKTEKKLKYYYNLK